MEIYFFFVHSKTRSSIEYSSFFRILEIFIDSPYDGSRGCLFEKSWKISFVETPNSLVLVDIRDALEKLIVLGLVELVTNSDIIKGIGTHECKN